MRARRRERGKKWKRKTKGIWEMWFKERKWDHITLNENVKGRKNEDEGKRDTKVDRKRRVEERKK